MKQMVFEQTIKLIYNYEGFSYSLNGKNCDCMAFKGQKRHKKLKNAELPAGKIITYSRGLDRPTAGFTTL